MAAQAALARLGYNPGAPDGLIGLGTRQALRAWQKDHGLPADGYLSPGIVARLRAAAHGAEAPAASWPQPRSPAGPCITIGLSINAEAPPRALRGRLVLVSDHRHRRCCSPWCSAASSSPAATSAVIIEALPHELMASAGAGVAAFLISNSMTTIKATGGGFGKVFSGPEVEGRGLPRPAHRCCSC